MVQTVISALYNETADFLRAYIDNFLAFTDADTALVVNLSDKSAADFGTLGQLHERVFAINGEVKRSAFGVSLLMGHLENLSFAQAVMPDFTYFCTMASNSLFFRAFHLERALAALQDAVDVEVETFPLDGLPGDWPWWRDVRDANLLPQLSERLGITRIANCQIEGLFAARADWELVLNLKDDIIAIGNSLTPGVKFPFEEIMPVTVFFNRGTHRFTNICHVHWERHSQNFYYKVTLPDIVPSLCGMPYHVCAQKVFMRSQHSLETWAVTSALGRQMIAGFDAVLAGGDANPAQARLLAERLLALGAECDTQYGRLIQKDGESITWQANMLVDTVHENNIRMIPLEDTKGAQAGTFLTERFGYASELAVEASISCGNQIGLSVVSMLADLPQPDGRPPPDSFLQGHLFVPIPAAAGQPNTVRVQFNAGCEQAKDAAHRMKLICGRVISDWRVAYYGEPVRRSENTLMSNTYYLAQVPDAAPADAMEEGQNQSSPCMIGLPVYASGRLSVTIEVLPFRQPVQERLSGAPPRRRLGLLALG